MLGKKTAIRVTVAATTMATLGIAVPQTAMAVTGEAPKAPASVGSIQFSPKASAETKSVVAAAPQAAAAAGNACGAGYTQSVYAERLPSSTTRYATLYLWTNGKETGPSYYDRPICAVLWNDTGAKQSMGIRLKDNYTSTPHTENFGSFSTYAGPVYQNRGYCGEVYSYMKKGGRVVIDTVRGVGSCN
ncbi:hypothetical protein [Streptomyces sp. NPDC046261]|uniref:hypothetical protein n=1 Tax=Streptomyces sp. NPDC046261 TaxID=3157200 RepID=UPI0033D750FC